MRGFVISLDLMLAFGVILSILYILTQPQQLQDSKYSIASDALAIMDKLGFGADASTMNDTLNLILPYESYSFQLIDFGDMRPAKFCSTDSDCPSTYPNCTYYICSNTTINILSGEYEVYAREADKLCSQTMISAGACKPDGDSSQRLVTLLDNDKVIHYCIARLEVAR